LQKLLVLVPLILSACGSPGYDSTNTIANSILIFGTVEQVNVSLSTQSCNAALAQILPLYDSINTNNDIRLATAASYGCTAKVNIFKILSDMTKSSDLGGSGLWKFLSSEFPSVASPDDKIPTAAGLGIDAAMAAVPPGTLIVPANAINATGKNPGSMLMGDRITNANSYITFLSMSLMGSLLYRDGKPLASTQIKTVPLPWQTAATAVGNGCAFASALLNFFDGLDAITGASPATVQASYRVISSFLTAGVNTACGLGCSLICGGASTCTSCPATLRDRNSCTGLTTDANSCAAAGLAAFVSSSWI
jgi:hypothetical protein